jgi:endonuclease/exonuclease/phosphatase family metal-dependent hydrolase
MNSSLYTISTTSGPIKLKVLQYNVDMCVREEKFEETKWINRKERVIKIINEIDADIVCLQELRNLDGNETINQFLSRFTQYHYKLEYRNPSTYSFGNAILYKPTKIYPTKTMKNWLSKTPDIVSDSFVNKEGDIPKGFGFIIMGILFHHVENGKIVVGKEPFWVYNTHLGLEEKLKEEQVKSIINILDVNTMILCGDFNFFPDKDGDKQRLMLTTHLNDLGKGAKTLQGRSIEGTFVGYEHDEFKADLSNMVSRLDNVFASKDVHAESAILYTRTMLTPEPEELTSRSTPSDHLPLIVTIVV